MPRKPEGLQPLTPAERQQRQRERAAARFTEALNQLRASLEARTLREAKPHIETALRLLLT